MIPLIEASEKPRGQGRPRRSDTPFPETVTAQDLCEIAGVSEQSIWRYCQDGILEKNPDGTFPWHKNIRALVRHYRTQARAPKSSSDKARREKADADSAEIKAAALVGTLVRRADVRRVFSDFIVQLRDVIQRAPLHDKHKKELTESVVKIQIANIDDQ